MHDLSRRYRVLSMALLGAISVAEASRRLSLSYRQTWTLYDRFRAGGGSLESLRFRRSHAAPNRTPDELRQVVLDLHDRYPAAGHAALAQLIEEETGQRLSAQTVRRIRLEAPAPSGRVTPIRRARSYPSHDARLLRLERLWLPSAGRRHVFQLIEDDVTGRPLVGWLFERGTAIESLTMVRWLLEQHGAPQVLFVADDGSFHLAREDYQRELDYRHEMLSLRAQVQQLLLELGTRVEMPRGVENPRLDHWAGFARDARRAHSLAEANLLLQRHIETMARGKLGSLPLTRPPRRQARFSPVPPSYHLDEAFCFYLRRRVGDDGCFRVDGVPYRVSRGLGYRGWAGIELGVRVTPGTSIAIFHQGELVEEYGLTSPRPAEPALLAAVGAGAG
jgi:hypothetical protein